jgi:hypothetical protein
MLTNRQQDTLNVIVHYLKQLNCTFLLSYMR